MGGGRKGREKGEMLQGLRGIDAPDKTCVSYLLVKNNKACVGLSIRVFLMVGLIHCGVSRRE